MRNGSFQPGDYKKISKNQHVYFENFPTCDGFLIGYNDFSRLPAHHLAAWRDLLYESFTPGFNIENPFRFKTTDGNYINVDISKASENDEAAETKESNKKRKRPNSISKRKVKSKKSVSSSNEADSSESSEEEEEYDSSNPPEIETESIVPIHYNTRLANRERSSSTPKTPPAKKKITKMVIELPESPQLTKKKSVISKQADAGIGAAVSLQLL